ncbi:GNAT family N-acetyltransferase [Halosimplex salinum]|uniref:GNAT family N-acetyltransferase n=1 Tax=Halosimplex salinum TaxID=1710538 RepID=UPI000F4AA567|nr:GNAT family N-acetyltransferase [Halosimplex salinum]
MREQVSYRAATTADAPAIEDVARDCWEHDYPDVISRESIRAGVSEWYDVDRLAAAIEDDTTLVLVAETESGAVVGFAHAVVDLEMGDILRLYVAPSHRGEGTGRELLRETVDELAAEGADTIRAMVLAENDTGTEFYRSTGFERVDESETRIGDESYREAVFERTAE